MADQKCNGSGAIRGHVSIKLGDGVAKEACLLVFVACIPGHLLVHGLQLVS